MDQVTLEESLSHYKYFWYLQGPGFQARKLQYKSGDTAFNNQSYIFEEYGSKGTIKYSFPLLFLTNALAKGTLKPVYVINGGLGRAAV